MKKIRYANYLALLSLLLSISYPYFAYSETAESLQLKINQRNEDIKNLEKEIASYQKQIDSLGSQATSLSSAIKALELSRKKLEVNISVTEDRIAAKNYEIQKLSSQITAKQGNITDDKRMISHSLVLMNQLDGRSLTEVLLAGESLASALDAVDELGSVQNGLNEKIARLTSIKQDLEYDRNATEKAKNDLLVLKKQLGDQKAVVVSTTKEEQDLLKQTKKSEANYKQILAEKKALKEAFEQELLNYESQLHLLVNPDLLPKAGKGVIDWPLDSVYVTQYFGNTDFATANPQIYNGKGHTGLDLRASIGTPVKAALSGEVVGTGNTDQFSGCYSYGKWVMIKHANGLSTLYAHLSLISVSKGTEVSTGQVIGYSGNTGYSTGPHLHFGVYATQGVQIKLFDTSRNCQGATIPIADFKAYLNPLSYL